MNYEAPAGRIAGDLVTGVCPPACQQASCSLVASSASRCADAAKC